MAVQQTEATKKIVEKREKTGRAKATSTEGREHTRTHK